MKRRDFIILLGGAAALPIAARGQQAGKVARIGFLGMLSAASDPYRMPAVREGLRDLGYIEGVNLLIEYRWADGHFERLPELAAELIRSNVDVIVTHATPGSLAAKQATSTIPIVIALLSDPVAAGIITTIARPGGNITGQSFFNPELRAKRIELLREFKPGLTEVAVLLNPDNPANALEIQAMEATARVLGVRLQPVQVRLNHLIALVSAFEQIEQRHTEAIETGDDPIYYANAGAIVALALKGRLISIGPKDFAQAGGIIGYSVNIPATFRRAAILVDKILKGAKPGDLPFEQATKFETVLNLRTAKALGFEVPTATLLRADEVIE